MKYYITLLAIIVSFGIVTLGNAPVFAANSVSVETIKGQSLNDIVASKIEHSWPWYIVRGSGIVAAIALLLLMLSGIGSITGHSFAFLEPLKVWATHRSLGIIFTVSALLHVSALLFDKFAPFSLLDILIPWLATTTKPLILFGINLGSTHVAVGIFALYLAIAITLTSLCWIDKKQKIWKFIHYASYIVLAFVFFHGMFIGTDTGSGVGLWIWVGGGVLATIAIISRLKRARAI